MFSFLSKRGIDHVKWPVPKNPNRPWTGPDIYPTPLCMAEKGIEPWNITDALEALGLPCAVSPPIIGPVTTTFTLRPYGSTRIGLLPSRAIDLAVRLGVPSVVVNGNEIEVANVQRMHVDFESCAPELIRQGAKHSLPYIIGVDSQGQVRIGDIATSPHILIAGSTGAGKSVFVNNIMASLMTVRNPSNVRFVMIDPKRVEYAQYTNLPHLMHPVIDETHVAVKVLEGLVEHMENRYRWLQQAGFQSVEQWNEKNAASILPGQSKHSLASRIYPIVVFIDEYADLVMQDKKVQDHVMRLGQKARAAGIHVILCTQHPLAKIIPTGITANFPTQIAFNVRTSSASRVILDRNGAENLLRQGDMIYQSAETTFRAQGPFVSKELTERMVKHWVKS